MTPGELDAVFAGERPRLVGLAYRITGSRLDAEDLVQEAWLRAQRADWDDIDRPVAWLTTVVSRLALDELKSARRRRETYVGPWLPEPVRTAAPPATEEAVELAESLTLGFLRVLETLDPVERVVFLLADVFQTPFGEIAEVVDRSPSACRQVASRARRRVREGHRRHDPPEEAERVAGELIVAVAAGDVSQVVSLLADGVVLISDGGAEVRAARRPVEGPERVARFLVNLAQRYQDWVVEVTSINDEPGVIVRTGGRLDIVLAVEVVDGKAQAIHAVRNPEKLAALDVETPLA